MSYELTKHLANVYGFADKRYRKVAFGRPIRLNSKEELNQNIHCLIFAETSANDHLQLTFAGAIPWDADVKSALKKLGRVEIAPSDVVDLPSRATVVCQANSRTAISIREVARAFKRTTGSGKRYAVKSWKFSSDEVSTDLLSFADALEEFFGDAR